MRPGRAARTAARTMLGATLAWAACTGGGAAAATHAGTPRHGTTPARSTHPAASAVGQPAPQGTGALAAIACGSRSVCVAVGQPLGNIVTAPAPTDQAPASIVLDRTTDAGTAWSPVSVHVADPTELSAISCANASHCMAVGSVDVSGPIFGTVLTTADGGRHWANVAAPAGSVNISAVQCTTASDCIVVATDGSNYWSALTEDAGMVWQRQGDLPPGFGGVSGVTCLASSVCMVAGYVSPSPGNGNGAIALSTNRGTTWTAATVPAGIGLLHALACTSSAHCIAVGTGSTALTDVAQAAPELLVSTDGGSSWASAPAPSGVDDAFAVACPDATTCVVVGTVWVPTNPPTPTGAVETSADGGTVWQPAAVRYVPASLTGIACGTRWTCTADGDDVLAGITLPHKVARTR